MNAVSKALTIDHDEQAQSVAQRPANVSAITPMDMLDRAISSGAGIEVLEKLMALQERWEANQARKAFDDAMAAAKAEIPVILKNRTVDFTGKTGIRTHYRHEDLAEIARTVDPILAKYGLSYRFRTMSPVGEPVTVTCVVSHRGGHSEENSLVGPRDDSGNKNPLQSIGSTISFLQRYTLKAALGLAASNDDDGKAAGGGDVEDAGPITEEQAATVRKLCEETNTDIPAFCEWLGVESIPTIPTSRLAGVLGSLNSKKRKLAS